MIVLALLVVLALTITAFLILIERMNYRMAHERMEWGRERGELISRVQRPEWIPPRTKTPPKEHVTEQLGITEIGSVQPFRDEG